MVLEKRWLFLIGKEAKIRPLEMGRKSPALTSVYIIKVGIIEGLDGGFGIHYSLKI